MLQRTLRTSLKPASKICRLRITPCKFNRTFSTQTSISQHPVVGALYTSLQNNVANISKNSQTNWRLFVDTLDRFVTAASRLGNVEKLFTLASQSAQEPQEKSFAMLCQAYYLSIYAKEAEQAHKLYNQLIVYIKQNKEKLEHIQFLVYFCRGVCDFQLRNFKHAIENFNKCLELNSTFANAFLNRSFAQYALSEFSHADQDFAKSLELDPTNKYDSYLSRGLFYHYDIQDPQKAKHDYDMAVKLNTKSDAAYLSRGWLMLEYFDDPEQAKEDFSKAIEINPTRIVAYLNRAMVLWEYYEDAEAALSDYDRVLELDPKHAQARLRKGVIYSDFYGDAKKAIEQYDQLISEVPNSAAAYIARAIAKARLLGLFDEALIDFNKGIELDPAQYEYYNDRGWLFLEYKKDYNKAIRDFTKSIEQNPKFSIAYNNRGTAYRALNKPSDALKDFSRAIENDPLFTLGLLNRAALLTEVLEQHEEAINDLNQALQISHKDASIYILRGNIYKNKLNNIAKANEDFAEAKRILKEQNIELVDDEQQGLPNNSINNK